MHQTEVVNLSGKQLGPLLNRSGMQKLVILPNYFSEDEHLPSGIVEVYDRVGHEIELEYLGPNPGCGISLAKFRLPPKNLEYSMNKVAEHLLDSRDSCLDTENDHFITVYETTDSDLPAIDTHDMIVAIHVDSQMPEEINQIANKVVAYKISLMRARRKRSAILSLIEKYTECSATPILDHAHNSLEVTYDHVVYRRGAVNLNAKDIGFIPSSMAGEAIIFEAGTAVTNLNNSLPHATGRKLSKEEARREQTFLDGGHLGLYIPYFINTENLTTKMPACYRSLDEVLSTLEHYLKIKARLAPKSSIMF